MANSDTIAYRRGMDEAVGFWLLVFVLVFAPLFRGGNRPLALMLLELGALGLAIYASSRPDFKAHLSRPLLAALGALFLYPLLQSIPLPPWIWTHLPGRDFYAHALSEIRGDTVEGWRAASLVPYQSQRAWLALLPPLTVFLVAVGLSSQRLQTLLTLFIGLAACQAILGLIQYGDGHDSLFRLGNLSMGGNASGTYVNRNHLAGLLEMALPVALALLAGTVVQAGRVHRHKRRQRSLRHKLAECVSSSVRINCIVLYGAVAILILLGLIFTRSRTGVTLAMLAILICTVMFSRRLGGRNAYGLLGTLTAIGIGLALEIGLAPVLDRFTDKDPLSDGRWTIFSSTLQAVGQFFPLGSGAGTFSDVFRRFQTAEMPGFVNRAHNDYLEWVLEGGLLMGGLLVVLLGFYFRQWSQVCTVAAWSPFRFAQVGAGIALFLMLLHSAVDFNLHIPANAVYFGFLAALFFHRYDEEVPTEHRRSRKKSDFQEGSAESRSLPLEDAVNPFEN